MKIPTHIEQSYRQILTIANANYLHRNVNFERRTHRTNNLLRQFTAQIRRILGKRMPDDICTMFDCISPLPPEDDPLAEEWLVANKLDSAWLDLAQIRFHTIFLMNWLIKAPNVYYYGSPR